MTTNDEDRTELLNRLRRIEGQVRGLQRMIEEGRECRDIVHQLAAVRAALDRVGHRLISSSVRACLGDAPLGEGVADDLERALTALGELRG